MAFDELKSETLYKSNKRFLIDKSQNNDDLKALRSANIGYYYNCSGVQDEIDDFITHIYHIIDDFECNIYKNYNITKLDTNKFEDVIYGLGRLDKILCNRNKLDVI